MPLVTLTDRITVTPESESERDPCDTKAVQMVFQLPTGSRGPGVPCNALGTAAP